MRISDTNRRPPSRDVKLIPGGLLGKQPVACRAIVVPWGYPGLYASNAWRLKQALSIPQTPASFTFNYDNNSQVCVSGDECRLHCFSVVANNETVLSCFTLLK